MDLDALIPGLLRLDAPLSIRRARVDAEGWSGAVAALAGGAARLVALWGSRHADTAAIDAAFALPDTLLWLQLSLPVDAAEYPDIGGRFPAAARMQRAAADLYRVHAIGAADVRPWLNHGLWPAGTAADEPARYDFVHVAGDGVHEIAVGPVHAGIIEPGHFRFSVVGEKVLRLEQRLGYTHKGIERRFTELAPQEACRLAGRVSGDSTVAHAWAYCMALEAAAGCAIPERATWLRALMLERERVANHLGDLGALGNDAALGFALAQFSRLREDWQRLSKDCFGHRLMMDCVCPGGVAADLADPALARLLRHGDLVERELRGLRAIFDEHAGLQDRFIGTGQVSPELAARLGLTGLAARASGLPIDLRCDPGFAPYDRLGVRLPLQPGGDVGARVAIRFDEALESLRLIRAICAELPAGAVHRAVELPARASFGAGAVEGWRGEVFTALELDAGGAILRCHPHDPSWQNWPVLEHAVIGNIVPDFPLINKSFNLSYSGQDL